MPVYAFDALAPGQAIDGPAVIESATTSVLLRPGDRMRTTGFGWLDIQRRLHMMGTLELRARASESW